VATLLDTKNEAREMSREERFDALYAEYKTAIKKRIRFLLHGANYEMLEDLEQTTWLKVWVGLTDGDGQRITYQWLSTIATHAVYDFLRKTYIMQHNRQEVPRPLFASLDAEWGTYEEIEAEGDFSAKVADREEISTILAAMKPGTRQIFLLAAAGCSYQEIMHATGCGRHKLGDVLHHTREKLRAQREEAVS